MGHACILKLLLIRCYQVHFGGKELRKSNWCIATSILLTMLSSALAEEHDGISILKNTDVGVGIGENSATINVETFHPIYLDDHSVIFFQGRAAGNIVWRGSAEEDWTINLGIGAREIIDNSVMLGLNLFYDQTTRLKHQRLGVGSEISTQEITARLNGYYALSDWKTVSANGNSLTEERALSGADGEVELTFPDVPWLRLSAGGYYWDAEANDDIVGFRAALRGDLNKSTSFELGGSSDNYQNRFWAGLKISLGPRDNLDYTAEDGIYTPRAEQKRDLSNQLTKKVVRTNTIVTERRATNGTSTSSAGIFISGE